MRLFLKALTHIPLPILYGFGFAAYCIVFHVMRWRRERAEADVANAFPEKSAEERARIVKACYRNLADTVAEAFWGYGASAEAIKARVTFDDGGMIRRAIDQKQTILLLAAHHGNWEWLLLAAGAYFPIPIDVVYQPQRLASFDAFLREVRCRFGGKLIPRQDFVYELLSHAGEPRAYALIADQTPRRQDPKYWTRFLRQDTAFFVGADKIAKFLDSPAYFVSMRRVRRGHYVVRLDVLAEPPYEDADELIIVERYARCLEKAIVENPEDWLWLLKKWKYAKPAPGEDTCTGPVPSRPGLKGQT
jgi:KDO2-lipid IV(A) lauroyltransferase